MLFFKYLELIMIENMQMYLTQINYILTTWALPASLYKTKKIQHS